MVRLSCPALLAVVVLALPAARPAAATHPDDEKVRAAVDRGVAFLKKRLGDGPLGAAGQSGESDFGIGPAALDGIALLEAHVEPSDAVVQRIAAAVREKSYTDGRTYQLSLCLLFLDKLGEPTDIPLIQMLAVRLLAGQTPKGGWTYSSVTPPNSNDVQALKTGLKTPLQPTRPHDDPTKPPPLPPLHPVVVAHAQSLKPGWESAGGDDNSNTQFAILAVWAARKHGVPVERSLDAINARFRASQIAGGWAYTLAPTDAPRGAMTCAGLLGLATSVARYEEAKALRAAAKQRPPEPEPEPKAKGEPAKGAPKPKNAFDNPAPREDVAAKKEKKPEMDGQVSAGLQRLGLFFAEAVQGRGGPSDLYFLWSLERVGVIFNVPKIGGMDWYTVGADYLLGTQAKDGSWTSSGHNGPTDVTTSFAILFLVKANLAKDLTGKMHGKNESILVGGGKEPVPPSAADPAAGTFPLGLAKGGSGAGRDPLDPGLPAIPKPGTIPDDEGSRLGADLAKRTGADFKTTLARIRDAKGGDYTKALVAAATRTEGTPRKEVREALAERLTRMTATTLRGMMKADNPELRRGAVVAAAMKDDKEHVPDLIDRLTDDEDLVVRAAKVGLKSLTGLDKDLGPKEEATKAEKKAAADAWKAAWSKQGK